MSLNAPPTLTTLPAAVLARQSDATLRAAAITAFLNLQPGMDVSQGQFPYDFIETFCLLLAQAYVDLEDVERRTSLATAVAADLDRLGDMFGVNRTPAAQATTQVSFTGTPGIVIPLGQPVATQGPGSQTFITQQAATIPIGGTVANVPVIATVGGSAGNVPAAAISLLGSPVPAGVTTVTNPSAATGGADLEVDGPVGQYITGYRADIRNLHDARGEGGASKHLRKWARNVSGVGGVSVLETTPQAGWATVALLDTTMLPASPSIVLAVEQAILDPWYLYYEAETLNYGTGFGASLDTQSDGTPVGGSNNVVKMIYSASGQGVIIHANLQQLLPQAGIWRLKPRLKVSSQTNSGNLVQFGVWNYSTNAWCTTRPNNNGGTALQTLNASQLQTSFQPPILDIYQDFAWNGFDQIEGRLFRLTADTVTTLWVDEINYFASMSRSDRDVGLGPAGARYSVIPAGTVTVNVTATLAYNLGSGQTQASVQAAAAQNIADYLASIAFQPVNGVRRAGVEDAIYQLTNGGGLADVNNVQLNGSTNNITVPPTSVAVLGTTTWS